MLQRPWVIVSALIGLWWWLGSVGLGGGPLPSGELVQRFRSPPDHARPWVYWFWLNGNITREGIRADLQAMRRAGIGGVLIMEVDQGAPAGPVPFAGKQWRSLFQHVCSEANRLGLEVNMNNDAGWCGSGGPWVRPELAMQKLVWTEIQVEGPKQLDAVVPQPKAVAGYYRDIALLAFPTPAKPSRIRGIQGKAAFKPMSMSLAMPAALLADAADSTIRRARIVDLTERLAADGRLNWQVPEGRWTVLRIGHTPTGKDNHPAPLSGRGLECDKLSKRAVAAHFEGLMGKLISDVGPLAGRTLVSTHIDSWEVGVQNWTPQFRQEFRQRRGYDLLPLLPVMTGRIVDSTELSERFLWDVRQTIGQLLLENYAGHMRELAHRHGLRLSIEAYHTCPCDELAYAGEADEPMGEFWSWRKYGAAFSCTAMASAAHVYGKRIVGAEAFTASNQERWLGHPGNIKELGDWAFCEGINRFVFHRYALQPWRDRRPGMSMGPWGLHYERTQTWWEQSKAWHEYLARCQLLLQQGLFVADICLLGPEGAPQSISGQQSFRSSVAGQPLERPGYNFDVCPPEVVLKRMAVKDGRLVLPDGMSYRLLALPQVERMTPQLLGKIKQLVEAGATIVGAPPLKSPSLSDYPECDEQVKSLVRQLWGTTDVPETVTKRSCKKGCIWWGGDLTAWRRRARQPAPRLAEAKWIWHREGQPTKAVPPGVRYFRRVVHLEADRPIESAKLVMTADNAFTCWINGHQVGSGNNFTRTYAMDLTRWLKPGANVIAVAAENGADTPNPAGLIAALVVTFRSGPSLRLCTDQTWQSAMTVPKGWTTDTAAAGSGWPPAMELGPLGMGPWGDIEQPQSSPYLFPEIAALGRLLKRIGVPPDFAYRTASSERPLRYIHRRLGGTDVYFVANKSPRSQLALCAFRVPDRRPELWWPETGRIERPAVYDAANGRVRLPIPLDPYQSVFVVFREGAKAEPGRVTRVLRDGQPVLDTASKRSRQAPTSAEAQPGDRDVPAVWLSFPGKNGSVEIEARRPGTYVVQLADGSQRDFHVPSVPAAVPVRGPWTVRFAPGWGAPERITLNELISWSRHSDPGVKYFSGAATYVKQLNVPSERVSQDRRLILDLGRVEVMAEVKLNGQNLGVLWKKPFQVDISEAVRPGPNRLEVTVVNLWVNRMIGDQQLAEDSQRNPNGTLKSWPEWLQAGKPSPTGRYTFTSWRLWSKDAPLVDSGLLGPVTLRTILKHQLPR